jgi:phosphoglycolate phosphatase-like HAD superfamily hydrolase
LKSALIAFDLDGVLYSSEPFLGEAYREAIANVNTRRPGSFAREPTTREILDHVGWPVSVIMQRLFPEADEEAGALLFNETLEVICSRVRQRQGLLYEGVPETLQSLHAAGHVLAVASNGRTRYIEAVLSTYNLAELFIDRIGVDQVSSKAAVLRGYLERLQYSSRDIVMVGDRASDVDAARTVGCPFIGCDYGHGYRHEIDEAGPVVGRFADLPGAIAQVMAER